MKLVFWPAITFGTAVIVVNYRSTVMSPVTPSGVTVSVVVSMTPVTISVPFSVRSAIVMLPVKFGFETVSGPIMVSVTLGMMTPAMTPVEFVMSRFIPFLKVAAAIPMTLADSLTLGPRISSYGQNKTN